MSGPLKTPEEWMKERDFIVYDPDGWRNEKIPWDRPISEEDFDRMAMRSTQAPKGWPNG